MLRVSHFFNLAVCLQVVSDELDEELLKALPVKRES